MIARYFLLCFVLLIVFRVNAQDRNAAEEYRVQMEQRKRADLLRALDSAVMFMDEEQYLAADQKLIYVLNNIKSIPSDLTFYFGKNSFYLSKFKQSIDWLNKYIQLKGPTGQFYVEALGILKRAETELVKEQSKNTAMVKQILSSEYEIDCGPAGKVTCPVCKGTTVLIRKGPFENQYKTCPYCDKHGFLTCAEYNLLIKGQLDPK
ncbi:hypothetical protein QQ054_25865 [Oscillatoria amoena NRMC-F 0135]|nr:hypothetical protein [Oscillatoria amoena NRMC-F 0135]